MGTKGFFMDRDLKEPHGYENIHIRMIDGYPRVINKHGRVVRMEEETKAEITKRLGERYYEGK